MVEWLLAEVRMDVECPEVGRMADFDGSFDTGRCCGRGGSVGGWGLVLEAFRDDLDDLAMAGRRDCRDVRPRRTLSGMSSSSDSISSIDFVDTTDTTRERGALFDCSFALAGGVVELSSSSELSQVVFLGAGFSAFFCTRPKLEWGTAGGGAGGACIAGGTRVGEAVLSLLGERARLSRGVRSGVVGTGGMNSFCEEVEFSADVAEEYTVVAAEVAADVTEVSLS